MKTDIARMISPVVVIAALVWAVPCRGQNLDIDIVVPEPGKSAAEGKEAGKRKPSQRSESHQGARRNARPRLDEVPPALDLDVEAELPGSQGRVSGEPTLAPPKGKPPRPWAAAAADDESGPEPAWANPAGIPLRQNESTSSPSTPLARDKQSAAKSPSAAKTSKNRGEGSKGASDRSGWLSRWFQAGRREAGQEESPSLVARRHRVTSPDHRQAPLASPSPWGNGRQQEPDRE